MAKKHISLWIDEDILKKSDANIKIAKLKNRSEFIEAAIDFYNGYLHNQVNESFIGKTLMNTFQSTMNSFEKRMARRCSSRQWKLRRCSGLWFADLI